MSLKSCEAGWLSAPSADKCPELPCVSQPHNHEASTQTPATPLAQQMAQFRLPDELTPVLTELRGLPVPAMGEAKATSPPRALDVSGKRDDGCGVKHWLW